MLIYSCVQPSLDVPGVALRAFGSGAPAILTVCFHSRPSSSTSTSVLSRKLRKRTNHESLILDHGLLRHLLSKPAQNESQPQFLHKSLLPRFAGTAAL